MLVHGFSANRLIMWPMAQMLRARGFRVEQWSYVSLFEPIDKHAARFSDFVRSQLAQEKRFHIVAHSMGSIVVQSALSRSAVANLGRLVFLAPPNHGSPVARFASKWMGRILTPTRELSDVRTSYVNQLKRNAALEVGIIAASFDLLVPIRSTHLANGAAHVVLNATHNSLLVSRKACDLTARFLRVGFFSP